MYFAIYFGAPERNKQKHVGEQIGIQQPTLISQTPFDFRAANPGTRPAPVDTLVVSIHFFKYIYFLNSVV